MNKTAFLRRRNIFITLIIIAFILIGLGFIHLSQRNKYVVNGDKVYAKIVNILTYPDSSSSTYEQDLKEYNQLLEEYYELGIIRKTTSIAIIVEYEYQGVKYTKELGYFSNDLYISQIVTIYVNKTNPTDFLYEGSSQFALYACFIIGTVLLISNLILLLIFRYNNKCNIILIEKGKCLLCEVLYADEDEKKSMFGRHPFVFTCVYNDEEKEEEIYFTSDSIYCKFDGTNYIGEKVKVYVDQNNKENYYIDTKAFE